MEHSKKMLIIIISCIALIGVFSAYVLIRTFLPGQGLPYERITMEQAAEYMEYESGYALVDVRTQEEYDEGHIPGAVCIPLEQIEEEAPDQLTDMGQLVYVYCRSGSRSRTAAKKLCNMGYTNVTEIGGIADWTGEIEK